MPTSENVKKLIIPGVVGNILEWYDFTVYGFLSSIVAEHFFPSEDKIISLILTFSVFASGFLMRPFGAAFFGHFGDRLGRKKTLITTIAVMTISTTVIGLLPTYQQIGVSAAILLTICRLAQGFACGGQFSGSMVYIIEHSDCKNRGFWGSFALFGSYVGFFLSSLVSALILNLSSNDTLAEWSWRIPFLFGSILGVVGIYLRMKMTETPQFLELDAAKKQVKNPLLTSLKQEPVMMLKAIAITAFTAVSSYLAIVYFPTYVTEYTNFPLKTAIFINTIGLAVMLPVPLLAGYLSDKLGRKPIFLTGAIISGGIVYPLFLLIHQVDISFSLVLLVQCLLNISVVTAEGTIPAILTEMFPTHIRYTAMSVPYNIANGLFGGTAPLVMTLLIAKMNNIMAPSFYMILAAVISIVTLFYIKETYKTSLR